MNTKQVHTCLDCLFSGNRSNEKGIIYCKYLQSPHNALKPCKDFSDDSQVKISDLEIQSIAENRRKEKRHKQILFWSKVTETILLLTLIVNIILKILF